MADLNAMLLFEYDQEDCDELREEIKGRLIPEFEWLGDWLPCFPVFTHRMYRGRKKFYLQPFFTSAAGCSVGTSFEVRMQAAPDGMLRECRSLYARHYGKLQDSPKLPKRKGVRA